MDGHFHRFNHVFLITPPLASPTILAALFRSVGCRKMFRPSPHRPRFLRKITTRRKAQWPAELVYPFRTSSDLNSSPTMFKSLLARGSSVFRQPFNAAEESGRKPSAKGVRQEVVVEKSLKIRSCGRGIAEIEYQPATCYRLPGGILRRTSACSVEKCSLKGAVFLLITNRPDKAAKIVDWQRAVCDQET